VALGVLVPNTAFAADPSIVVNWANSVDDDLGILQVSVTSDQAITHLKAHVLSPTTGEEVAATEDFVLNSGTAENGVWRTADTFKLGQLDAYPVTIDATAADGTEVTADRIGALAYYARTLFDPLTPNRPTVDYAHRSVTVSGRLLSRNPGTRELTAFAGATVWSDYRVYDRSGNTTDIGAVELRSDADGRFAFRRTLTGKADFDAYYTQQSEFPGYVGSISDRLTVGVTPSPVRVTATAAPNKVDAGGQVTVSGQATWKSPSGWQPLTGAVFFLDTPWGSPEVTTDVSGNYITTVTPSVSANIVVRYEVHDPFMGDGTSKPLKVTVVQPSDIREFDAQPGDDPGTVRVSGVLEFPGVQSPGDSAVDIQFSPDGTTWSRKATLPNNNGLSGLVPANRPGYWRAHYRGASGFQPATSEAVYSAPR
jgi:hypothetical protein